MYMLVSSSHQARVMYDESPSACDVRFKCLSSGADIMIEAISRFHEILLFAIQVSVLGRRYHDRGYNSLLRSLSTDMYILVSSSHQARVTCNSSVCPRAQI